MQLKVAMVKYNDKPLAGFWLMIKHRYQQSIQHEHVIAHVAKVQKDQPVT